MASFIYDSFLRDVPTGAIDLDTDTFKLMLMSSSYTPSRTAHTKRSDITNEVTGTGYIAGGSAVTFTPALDTTNHREDFTLSSVSWPGATFTTRYGAIYKSRGGASSADELVMLLDFGTDQVITGFTFLVNFTSTLRYQG